MKKVILLTTFVFCFCFVWCQTSYTRQAAGNWNALSGWQLASLNYPDNNSDGLDDATIEGYNGVTQNVADIVITDLDLRNGGTGVLGADQAGNLTINQNLEITGTLTMNPTGTNGSTITIASGATLTINNLIMTPDAATPCVIRVAGGGTLEIKGNTTFSNGATIDLNEAGNSILRISSTDISAAEVTTYFDISAANEYTVQYDHSGTQNTIDGLALYHLEVTGGGEIDLAQASLTLAGDLTVTSGTFDVQNNTMSVGGNTTVDGKLKLGDTHGFSMTGNFDLNAGAILEIGSGSATGNKWAEPTGTATIDVTSTVDYNGGNGMIIDNTNTYGNLIIDANAGTTTLAGNVIVDGDLTVEAGTLDIEANTIDNDAADGSDDLTLVGSSKLVLASTFPANYDNYNFNSSTVEYNANLGGDQTIVNHPYNNLTISNNGTKTMTDFTSTGTGTLRVNTGAELIVTGTTDFPTFGSYNMGNGQVTLKGGDFAVGVVDISIGTLEIDLTASSNEILINNNCDITIVSSLIITQGILDVTTAGGLIGSDGSQTLTITANGELELGGVKPFPTLFAAPTLDVNSTVDFYGTNQNVGSTTGTVNFGNLIIRGSLTKTLVGNIEVQTLLDVQAGTLLTNAFTITGTGTDELQVLSGATLNVGSSQFPTAFDVVDLQSGSTVEFTAVGAQTVNDDGGDDHVSFYNIYLEGSGTKTLTSGIAIQNGGTLDVGGDADVASGITFDTDNNDILLTTALTLDIDGSNVFETSAADVFSTATITETINTTSTFLYNGGAQNVSALDYGNLTIDQAGIKTLQGNSSPTGDVTISNTATFDIETYTFTGAGGKTLDINDDCRLALSGAANFPTGFGTFTFNTTSTVDYDLNGAQTIALHNYANLDITGGGTKTVDVGEAGVTGILDVEDGATITTSLAGGNLLRLISTGDGETQTARIADLSDESTGTLAGDGFICERDMDLTGPDVVGWNDWASPITGFRLASWYYKGWPMTGVGGIRGSDYPSNPWCSVLTYNANNVGSPTYLPSNVDDGLTDKNDGWERAPSITTGNNPGTGFRLYTGARDRELEDIGLPHQDALIVNLNYLDHDSAADSEEGWNLVGNPYMCTVDFDLITKTGDVESSMWMYSNVGKGYYAYNAATTTGNAPFNVTNNNDIIGNGYIPSHKAFWVKVTEAAQTLTFKEADKVTGGTAYVKNGATLPKLRVQAQNLNNGFFSTGVIVKHDDATIGYEKYDSEIFKALSATAPNLFFLSEEGTQLSIDAVPNDVSLIPMQVEAGVSGDFELRFWDFNEIHSGSCIWLEDKFTDEWFDLREEQSIVRTLSDTTTVARFNIHINPMLNTELVANTTCFGTNDGEVLVENLSENVIGLALYDEQGELVYEDMVTRDKVWTDLAPGKYTLREANTNIGCPSAFTTVEVFEPAEVVASFDKSVAEIDLAYDNGEVQFTSTSTGGEEHIWFFSDNNEFSFETNPTHTFSTPGLHDVSLLVHNGNYDCAKAYEDQVLVKSSVGITEEVLDVALVNATVVDGQAKLTMNFESPENVTVLLFDMAGKELGNWNYDQVSNNTEFIDLPTTKGIYLLKVQAANKKKTFRLF